LWLSARLPLRQTLHRRKPRRRRARKCRRR
jgi:hypothetical protein